jgi:hypothetical protein
MNFELFEKLLTEKPKVPTVVVPDVASPTDIIATWIETPKSKVVRRYGYNATRRILGVVWHASETGLNSTEMRYYVNISPYLFDRLQRSGSIGKTIKCELSYKSWYRADQLPAVVEVQGPIQGPPVEGNNV